MSMPSIAEVLHIGGIWVGCFFLGMASAGLLLSLRATGETRHAEETARALTSLAYITLAAVVLHFTR